MIKSYYPCDYCPYSETCNYPCEQKNNFMPDIRTKINIKTQAEELQKIFDDYYLENLIEEKQFRNMMQDRISLLYWDTRGME